MRRDAGKAERGDRAGADVRAVHHHGVHADGDVIGNLGPVHHGPVTDGHAVAPSAVGDGVAGQADAPSAAGVPGAVGFAEWLNITYGDYGVRVSCLCPMAVNTRLLHAPAESGAPCRRNLEGHQ